MPTAANLNLIGGEGSHVECGIATTRNCLGYAGIEAYRLVESWVSCGIHVEASVLLERYDGFVLTSSW